MSALQIWLTRPSTLWRLLLLTLILTAGFGLIMLVWDFGIIDEMYSAPQILAHLDAMTPTQKRVHLWMTATLDVAYPLVYGALFIGVALHSFGVQRWWLALPGALVIPVDLAEGVVQVMLLSGQPDVVGLKEWVTPLKLLFYVPGLIITLAGLAVAVCRRPTSPSQEN